MLVTFFSLRDVDPVLLGMNGRSRADSQAGWAPSPKKMKWSHDPVPHKENTVVGEIVLLSFRSGQVVDDFKSQQAGAKWAVNNLTLVCQKHLCSVRQLRSKAEWCV